MPTRDELLKMLWKISLADRMCEVMLAIDPIVESLGISKDRLNQIQLKEAMIEKDLLPDYAKEDYKDYFDI